MPYIGLSNELRDKILADNPALKKNLEKPLRRRMEHDKPNLWRPAYVRDCEKILHSPYYNRYADKTQFFSFYKNDDISRRSLHVQLVARIAKNISSMLGLDINLTEAIALGHDIGHTPFGHASVSLACKKGVKVCDCYSKWKKLSETQDITNLLANRINHPTKDMHELFASSLFEVIFEGTEFQNSNSQDTMYKG